MKTNHACVIDICVSFEISTLKFSGKIHKSIFYSFLLPVFHTVTSKQVITLPYMKARVKDLIDKSERGYA